MGKSTIICVTFLFIFQLHNAANANQKEKYEADLKKEIKKLQVSKQTLILAIFIVCFMSGLKC